MSGMGAVQQFFEALGVARPPQVQVNPTSLSFEGKPGKVFEATLEVVSAERKVVYGWATSDRYWATVGKTKLTGRSAVIPIAITVPDRKGTQEGKFTVVGNGQQKFVVPVKVAVIGGADILDAEIVEVPETLEAQLVDAPAAAPAAARAPPAAPAPVAARAPIMAAAAAPAPAMPAPAV